MAALALKAVGYGAEKIPDSLFEKIPGGFFTPAERKKIKKNRDDDRRRSEQRHSDRRRRSHRDRTPPTDYSDYSGYDDTDYEKEYRKKQSRRRAKSLGRSYSHSRSLSRGRRPAREDTDLDGEMDRAERGPEFLPPPTSEYRPYNPQDYAPAAAATNPAVSNQYYDQYDGRGPSSAMPEYGYPSQVNSASPPRFRSATVGAVPTLLTPTSANSNSSPSPYANLFPFKSMSSSPINYSSSSLLLNSPTRYALQSCTSPFQRAFSPSYEPPLAALLYRSVTDSPQPQPQPMNTHASVSSSAARYTPASAYAQAPVTTVAPPSATYPPYNPADYASPSPTNRAPVGYHPTPPPFYRQESRSQPSLPQYPHPTDHLAYLEPPSRQGSTSSSHRRRHGDGKHHRTRSADHHGRSSSRVTDRLRDRFENLDMADKNLAASVGGALAGGAAGRAIGKGTLSTIVGAAIGGLGGREFEKRHEK
jgi:hypothetical protein